ncbi:MAG: AprI/Inh family metalloprotease inhibitor [Methylocystis sp.]
MVFGKNPGLRAWKILVMAAAVAATADSAQSESRTEAAGRYAILRADDKETGCMLTLEQRPAPGGFKAQLAPACRDNGLVVFDPVAWSLDHGRLSLVARKGHTAHFDHEASGVWRRDSKEGKALSLRPM